MAIDLPETLQSQLDEYNANFERMTKIVGTGSLLEEAATADLRVEKTKEFMTAALPIAVSNLLDLACNGESESVRLKASTYLIDRCIGKEGKLEDEDEVTKLFKRLQTKA